jgi:hypothetical protein
MTAEPTDKLDTAIGAWWTDPRTIHSTVTGSYGLNATGPRELARAGCRETGTPGS